ncbi:glycosyltransferase [Limibaculum sp. FT325]|uniref:glycosyltransferase family 2 protein n=1 Tax=Thermohalobaculum sediminis TaxID=2939436 RepID=UPI0020BE8835|nr:glycosyltransferase [Limibaculum sediminis]MCL5777887.1 glycosyltransferase [Limibaculum sediminis]
MSVVIPTYNRPQFLREAVESVLAQTLSPREIIVVDDCSPVEVTPHLAGMPSWVIYYRLSKNRGVSAARNKGVELATSDFVAFLDDDDVWETNYLEFQVAALAKGAEAALCGFSFMDLDGVNVVNATRVSQNDLRWGNKYCGATGLFARRDVLLQERWDETLRYSEDWDLFIRLSKRCDLAYSARPLFRRRFGNHESLVLAGRHADIDALERRALVLCKHREWLGEFNYRYRLASYLLTYIGAREQKMLFFKHAIRRAGIVATASVIFKKFASRLMWRRT